MQHVYAGANVARMVQKSAWEARQEAASTRLPLQTSVCGPAGLTFARSYLQEHTASVGDLGRAERLHAFQKTV